MILTELEKGDKLEILLIEDKSSLLKGNVLREKSRVYHTLNRGRFYRVNHLQNLLKEIRLLMEEMCRYMTFMGRQTFSGGSIGEVSLHLNKMINSRWSRLNPRNHKILQNLVNKNLHEITEGLGLAFKDYDPSRYGYLGETVSFEQAARKSK